MITQKLSNNDIKLFLNISLKLSNAEIKEVESKKSKRKKNAA